MSRRRNKKRRGSMRKPDLVFNNVKVTHLTNTLMLDGKFSKSYNNVCKALLGAAHQLEGAEQVAQPVDGSISPAMVTQVNDMIERLIEAVGPHVEVKSKRMGGATYPVPTPVRPERRISLAFRLLVQHARARKGMSIADALMREIVDAFRGTGGAYNACQNILKMAKANIAFAK